MENDNNEMNEIKEKKNKKINKESKGTKNKTKLIMEAIQKIVAWIILIAMVAASAGYLISYIVNL